MTAGYGGTYRAVVMDNTDPMMQNRLLVLVPDVNSEQAWATPSVAPGGVTLPAVGDEVLVSFEGGDSDYPLWHPGTAPETQNPSGGGYIGSYRATVIDNLDPMQSGRLMVSVPDVPGLDPLWADRASSLDVGTPAPDIGSEVWVEFEGGDTNHPVWVGVP